MQWQFDADGSGSITVEHEGQRVTSPLTWTTEGGKLRIDERGTVETPAYTVTRDQLTVNKGTVTLTFARQGEKDQP